MQPFTDEDLDKLPVDARVLDHLIDIENELYHHAMDPTIDEEEFISFFECTSTTGTYLHHDSYSPDYMLCLKHYTGYVQKVDKFMKSSQTHNTWKDSHHAKPTQMSGCDAMMVFMNMLLFMRLLYNVS